MNSETGVWVAVLAFVFGVLGAFARFVQRLSRLESRIERCEEDDRKIDALLARLIGQMQIVTEALGAARLHAAENYVPLERMASVEGKIEASQAEHGDILKSIKDSLAEMKASIARR